MKIAIIGAPGTGKTTIASGIYYNLKVLNKGSVDLIPELAKYKIYQNLDFKQFGFDIQNAIQQKELQDVFENANPTLDIILTEAPLCVPYFYATFYNSKESIEFTKALAKRYTYDKYILLKHSPNSYETFGRNESFITSKQIEDHIDNTIRNELNVKSIYECTCYTDINNIIDYIMD